MKTTLLIAMLLVYTGIRSQSYIFYLHGMIVENKGADAVDSVNGYGKYQYRDILDSLRAGGKFIVISEVRPKNTDVKLYAKKVCRQIDSLILIKTNPEKITVIGASKGSLIAMYVSSYMKNQNINYVFMAACTDGLASSAPDLTFSGNVLSIYEKNDFAGSCNKMKPRSPEINHYKEIVLSTGLRHGFLYRPLREWVHPALKWASGDRQ